MKKVLGLIAIIFVVLLSLTFVSCNKSTSSGGVIQYNQDNNQDIQQDELPNDTQGNTKEDSQNNQQDNNQNSTSSNQQNNKELTAVEIYEKVNPSVVCVFALDINGNLSSGSGFFIDTNGKLVTNYHVIKDAVAIIISTYNNEKDSSGNWYNAKIVVGMDKDLDIAILQTNKSNSIPVSLDVGEISVGEKVYAIGYPESFALGWEESTFSQGMITKKSMVIDGKSYIQSDVNITHGNSGGVLINEKGKVIGITSAGIRFNGIDYMNLSILVDKISIVTSINLPVGEIPYYYLSLNYNFYVDEELFITKLYSYWDLERYPNQPTKVGYTFVGWKERESKQQWSFTNKVTRSKQFDAIFSANVYEITLDCNEGNLVGNNKVSVTYDSKITLPIPSKDYYDFCGWYLPTPNGLIQYTSQDGLLLNKWNIADNQTLIAEWEKTQYSISCKQNKVDAGNVSYPATAAYGDNVTITATTYSGYTWVGWYKDNELVQSGKTYSFSMPAQNIVFEARWCKVSLLPFYNEAGYVTPLTGTYIVGQNVTITGTTNPGYTWIGWYKNGILVSTNIDYKIEMPSVDETYEARWTYYTLTTIGNDVNAGTISNYKKTKVTAMTSVTIEATTFEGYTFDGWYNNDSFVTLNTKYTFSMPSNNEVYEARWSINSYTVSVNNYAEGVTICGEGNFDYGTFVTLSATNIPNNKTINWKINNQITHRGNIFSFKIGAHDVEIDSDFVDLYTRSEDVIYFGLYPQTMVTDNSIQSALNSQAGTKPASSNSYLWTDYGYYISGSVQSYMWYQDITYDGEKYRGVYFTRYRPRRITFESTDSNSYQDDNGYNSSTIYWFKWEPIKWKILKEENEAALLISELLLDSQDYYWSNNTSSHNHNDGIGYSNNYKLSHIRQWLNDTFYNSAFIEEEKTIIKTTDVVNNSASTGSTNAYACDNTQDKVFLLSYSEINSYCSTINRRKIQGTDYAMVQGLEVNKENGNWWLRSPYPNNSVGAFRILDNGYFANDSYDLVYDSSTGVRPVLWINL